MLKKPTLKLAQVENYRLVSLLPYLSKILECTVYNQVSEFLSENNQYDPNQSGFKQSHSTETALLSVMESLRTARAAGQYSALLLLDLSAAFDTVNHQILLFTLTELVISGTALRWSSRKIFQSILEGGGVQTA